jgi:hypothetical protein
LSINGTFKKYKQVAHFRTAFFRAIKGKVIPFQPWTGPEDSRRLRLPDFKTVGT